MKKNKEKWKETEEYWEFHVTFKDGNGHEHEDTCSRPRLIDIETNIIESEIDARKSIIYDRQKSGFCVSKIERLE
jgi:hypothetical protein